MALVPLSSLGESPLEPPIRASEDKICAIDAPSRVKALGGDPVTARVSRDFCTPRSLGASDPSSRSSLSHEA